MLKKRVVLPIILIALALAITSVSALSNESTTTNDLISKAQLSIPEMQLRNITVVRINETLNQAITEYETQLFLEKASKQYSYKKATSLALEAISIKDNSLKAQDELRVFLETYNTAAKETNLSSMDSEYNAILSSFSGERFEDTPDLIKKGYSSISDIQSKNTAVKLFYDSTSRTLKRFFIVNGQKFISLQFYQSVYFYVIIIAVLSIVFWKIIIRAKIKIKLKALEIRKKTLYTLIQSLQREYFETKKMSETEYFSKIEKFKDMIREIDRETPLIREELYKLGTKEASMTERKPRKARKSKK
jgi:hypothetical protein